MVFKAIKLQPLRHAYCADSEIVDPVLDKAEEYGIPVCIHSGHPPYSLPWQIGLLAERHPNCKSTNDSYGTWSWSLY